MVRGVRGATTIERNEADAIIERVKELLVTMVEENDINLEDIAAVYFSSTTDLTAAFPALAARRLGWIEVPLFGGQEIDCETGVGMCVRILILLNTDLPQSAIKHSYLYGASVLRPEFSK